jgi:hypothetical protein
MQQERNLYYLNVLGRFIIRREVQRRITPELKKKRQVRGRKNEERKD